MSGILFEVNKHLQVLLAFCIVWCWRTRYVLCPRKPQCMKMLHLFLLFQCRSAIWMSSKSFIARSALLILMPLLLSYHWRVQNILLLNVTAFGCICQNKEARVKLMQLIKSRKGVFIWFLLSPCFWGYVVRFGSDSVLEVPLN